jgi:metal-responsive CopG/Arc/MetJ family transcriptional regulator
MSEIEIKDDEIAGKVRMNFWLPRQLFSYVEYVSSRDERTLSEIIREALRDFVSKDRKLNGDDDGNQHK